MNALVSVRSVSKRFIPTVSFGERIAAMLGSPVETRPVHAVDDVSLEIARGEVLGWSANLAAASPRSAASSPASTRPPPAKP